MADIVRSSQAVRTGFLARNWSMPLLFRGQPARNVSRDAPGNGPSTGLGAEDPRAQARLELARYRALFPAEVGHLEPVEIQLGTGQDDVLGRRNMRGHITTSAFVLDGSAMKALLIHDRLPNRWVHPGGHYRDRGGPLWASAIRKAVEKTGIRDPRLHDWWAMEGCPLDIDSRAIAARPARGEQAHVHHDFAYLVSGDSAQPLTARLQKAPDARWVSLAVLEELGDPRLCRIVAKLESQGIVPARTRFS
jgi:8-oxo-dGTP pyrophosphatase MutT (NUDIX family)